MVVVRLRGKRMGDSFKGGTTKDTEDTKKTKIEKKEKE
jgi:hypothetical protein